MTSLGDNFITFPHLTYLSLNDTDILPVPHDLLFPVLGFLVYYNIAWKHLRRFRFPQLFSLDVVTDDAPSDQEIIEDINTLIEHPDIPITEWLTIRFWCDEDHTLRFLRRLEGLDTLEVAVQGKHRITERFFNELAAEDEEGELLLPMLTDMQLRWDEYTWRWGQNNHLRDMAREIAIERGWSRMVRVQFKEADRAPRQMPTLCGAGIRGT